MTTAHHERAAIGAMYAGLGLTVAAMIVLYVDADFEDHAEHEYIAYVAEHPELETQPDPGTYAAEYGRYGSLADLFRQIGHDERVHKLDSLANLRAPRPHQAHEAGEAS